MTHTRKKDILLIVVDFPIRECQMEIENVYGTGRSSTNRSHSVRVEGP